jgi:hypothetical protein
MRDELAERLLAAVMGWNAAQVADVGTAIQTLATLKYDTYRGYRPGEKFLESLARWLWQFDSEDRERALQFVLKELVFVSAAELGHAIETVYPDVLRPRLMSIAAAETGQPRHRVQAISSTRGFRILQRRMLVLGLSDGARLDLLRRTSPELSHEQFWLSPELGNEARSQMANSLRQAFEKFEASDTPPTFVEVVLVDDFSGSGFTLLRQSTDDASWKGKLAKAHRELKTLAEEGLVDDEARVLVLLYVTSDQAERTLQKLLKDTGWGWDMHVLQPLPSSIVVQDESLIALCENFYDPILDDEHKGRAPLGFGACALPLVLEHNTPNNSISLLWADSTDESESTLHRHALFPRYERHHRERP